MTSIAVLLYIMVVSKIFPHFRLLQACFISVFIRKPKSVITYVYNFKLSLYGEKLTAAKLTPSTIPNSAVNTV